MASAQRTREEIRRKDIPGVHRGPDPKGLAVDGNVESHCSNRLPAYRNNESLQPGWQSFIPRRKSRTQEWLLGHLLMEAGIRTFLIVTSAHI